jgi:hypothetical protein
MVAHLLLLIFPSPQGDVLPEQADREWVIRDLFGQEDAPPGFDHGWSSAYGLWAAGDLDTDRTVDVVPFWYDIGSGGVTFRDGLIVASGGLHLRSSLIDQHYQEWLALSSDHPSLYGAPGGLLLHARGAGTHGLQARIPSN